MDNETESLGIIGISDRIEEIRRIIRQVADTDVAVLIQGESGTGKELVARAIHELSNHSSKDMVSVNCGAIPEGILESELFGHEKGSFTGAVSQRKGYFEIADNSSIFLDEIGEMSLITQVKLLRVLENGEFIRVGSSKTLKSNARIIAATNKNLDNEVQKGNFREDLFYRLKSVTINLPPLRERGRDINLLIEKFISDLEIKYKTQHGGLDPEVLEKFLHYKWPGNIRELKNLLESLFLLKKGGLIEKTDLPDEIKNSAFNIGGLPVAVNKTTDQAERELIYRALIELKSDISDIKNLFGETLQRLRKQSGFTRYDGTIDDVSEVVEMPDEKKEDISVEKIEAEAIKEALRRYNGNRRLAAKALGISERTLYRRLEKLDLKC
ncbi:sigma-54 interaction domain-containing protein [candidate division KSB1 bacterium]